eukprot:CAMPEP_0117675666 /NCGR_PEP_ID=MMETSP0804-20121206/15736_1 /TAXON_ID=1074897 /ORGANISM="Tetraselmis astigmatica, Strain CCMP880" /LENGTH=282 /DNA_ID=CAMNT_0005484703 /DNA_START=114 /DNA_END=962 /DNA_ORIENTATION=+
MRAPACWLPLLVVVLHASAGLQAVTASRLLQDQRQPGGRRLLVLHEVFNGGAGHYVNANDEIFKVLRTNKWDVEMLARGDTAVVDVLRSGAQQLTSWTQDPVNAHQLREVQHVIVLSFGEAGSCTNDGLAWLTANQYVGTSAGVLGRNIAVTAQSHVADFLMDHGNFTALAVAPSNETLDMSQSIPQVVQTMAQTNSAMVAGSAVLLVSHPDQTVRAVELVKQHGYKVYVPDYQAMPWTSFGCNPAGYSHNATIPRFSSRTKYIQYELYMRAMQAAATSGLL